MISPDIISLYWLTNETSLFRTPYDTFMLNELLCLILLHMNQLTLYRIIILYVYRLDQSKSPG